MNDYRRRLGLRNSDQKYSINGNCMNWIMGKAVIQSQCRATVGYIKVFAVMLSYLNLSMQLAVRLSSWVVSSNSRALEPGDTQKNH